MSTTLSGECSGCPGNPFLLPAAVLLVLTCISHPVNHIYPFLSVNVTNSTLYGNGTFSFGALGYCFSNASSSTGSFCSHTHAGYDITGIISAATGTHYADSTLNGLTRALALHPLATSLTFIALLISIGSIRYARFVAGFTWLIMLVVVIIDFHLFVTVRNHVNRNDFGARAEYDDALWLTLAAFISLFLSLGVKRKNDNSDDSDNSDNSCGFDISF